MSQRRESEMIHSHRAELRKSGTKNGATVRLVDGPGPGSRRDGDALLTENENEERRGRRLEEADRSTSSLTG